MALTQFAFVYDPKQLDASGNPVVIMVIKPDLDGQLNDLAFNPKGCVQSRVSIAQYQDPRNAGTGYLQAMIPGYKAPVIQVGAA